MKQNANAAAAKTTLGRPQKKEPGMVRINVQVALESHTKLKVFCAQNNTTITDFFRKQIDDLPS